MTALRFAFAPPPARSHRPAVRLARAAYRAPAAALEGRPGARLDLRA